MKLKVVEPVIEPEVPEIKIYLKQAGPDAQIRAVSTGGTDICIGKVFIADMGIMLQHKKTQIPVISLCSNGAFGRWCSDG